MKKQFLLIDGNSIGHQANCMPSLNIGSMQTQAIFGFLRILRSYASKYSLATPVVLWDGLSWRSSLYPEYKQNRKREETKHELARKEQNRQYQLQRPHIEKALSFLGVTQVKASNMEADDLAGIMSNLYSKQGHRVALLTEDQDWLQLIQSNVWVERPVKKDRITLDNFEDVTGVKSTSQFVEKKALMGDAGDNISGIGGVGEKRALEFLNTYGSFNSFLNQVTLEKTLDLKELPKWQRDLVEDESKAIAFDFNLKLVNLSTTARPTPMDMNVFAGEPSAENFRRFCELLLFKSITDQFDVWISAFAAHASAIQAVA
jgi:5'-3' exonuclease